MTKNKTISRSWLKQKLLDQINKYQTEWRKHLDQEKGSCYCMASEESCLPERVRELNWVLGLLEDEK